MAKENLEAKSMKVLLNINDNVTDIRDTLHDLSMKVCYLIKNKGRNYSISQTTDYEDYY
jgi:hypothetical protein